MATAISISGRTGQHSLINGVYEPAGRLHNDRGIWVSRAVRPLYLFHTGKSRWVISKRVDSGEKCYAFLEDTAGASDPLRCQARWTCCESGGDWREDGSVTCSGVPVSHDKFVLMRMALDQEMDKHGLNDLSYLRQLWKRLDCNGNDIASLAEVDKLVSEMARAGTWPSWVNSKPALMRAFKKADLQDGDGDGWIGKAELHALLLNIFWFGKLWQVFDLVDEGNDRKISAAEFARGMAQLDLQLSQAEAEALFREVDRNSDGQIQFVEFCAYARDRVSPGMSARRDRDLRPDNYKGQEAQRSARSGGRTSSGAGGISHKSMTQFAELEAKIVAIVKDRAELLKLWRRLDYNGNGKVSLAEIDKLVVQEFPILDRKPALMRAYRATCQQGNGDDFVDKKEFKSLLGNLFYFNKIFWLFDQADADNDRRMTQQEFKWMISVSGAKMSEAEAAEEFKRVDRNQGGVILFDEFCQWFTHKACPECFVDLVE